MDTNLWTHGFEQQEILQANQLSFADRLITLHNKVDALERERYDLEHAQGDEQAQTQTQRPHY